MDQAAYSVKTPVFEGPLDLLLDLIERRKLFVGDISLAAVTDDFIRYIETHDEFPLGESAEFIVTASTLMLVKSRSLLPALELTTEEEQSIDDLEHRLALYKRTKELAGHLRGLFGHHMMFEAQPTARETIVFSPDQKTTVESLASALERVLNSLPKKEILGKAAVRQMVSLEETIERLSARISQSFRMTFADFASGADRAAIIVGFLALLELVKRGAIRAEQGSAGEISIESETISTPIYA